MTTQDPIAVAIQAYETRPAAGLQRFWIGFRAYVEEWPEDGHEGDRRFFYWHSKDGASYRLRHASAELAETAGLPPSTDVVMTGIPHGADTQQVLDQHYVRDAMINALIDAPSADAAVARLSELFPDHVVRFVLPDEGRTLTTTCVEGVPHPAAYFLRKPIVPTYRKEFPDYDDEIPSIPGMIDRSWHNEAMPMLANEVAGFRLWCDYKDPKLSQEPIDEFRQKGSMKRYALHRILDPHDVGKDRPIIESDDLDEVLDAYAAEWISKIAVDIGLGFHPDTSVENYVAALEPAMASQYEDMIAFADERLEDMYGTSLEAWEKAGLIPSSVGPA